jgi:hypothetical protein
MGPRFGEERGWVPCTKLFPEGGGGNISMCHFEKKCEKDMKKGKVREKERGKMRINN